ncbi:MAG: MFS transporter [Desulfatitalea sp. BRH_c12]|nr:MAG: MFS transporter [Desulfatitalea sp. BRH_c12]
MQSNTPPPLSVAWSVWGLGALFYLMAFFHRVAPAVMTEELMRDFQIGATALGNLSAYYFYSYVAMQIPTGVFADTLGPRRLLSTGAWAAAAGTILFALAPTLFWAGLGRLLIGASVAVAFVGMLKLSTCWFPPRYYAMIAGMIVFVGIIGAVGAGPPLRLLMDHYSWRGVMLGVAVVSLAIGVLIRLFVRDCPHEKGFADWAPNPSSATRVSLKNILAGVSGVFRYRNTLLLMVIPGALTGGTLTFAGLWGVPFLTTHYNLQRSTAAMLTSALLVCLALSGPIIGYLSDRWQRRKPLFIIGCAATLVGWSVVWLIPDLPMWALVTALLLTGFFSGSMILTFAFAKESVPAEFSGTISGVINMGVMMGPMLMQPAVGWMLDHQWQGTVRDGVRIYSREAYQVGFSMILVWIVLSVILLFFTRETYCRQIK